MPKLNIPVTDAFATALRDVARSAGYKSTAEYVRVVLAERMQVAHVASAWGGKRQDEQLEAAMQSQDAQVVQVTHLEAPASLPVKQVTQLGKVTAPTFAVKKFGNGPFHLVDADVYRPTIVPEVHYEDIEE